MMTLKKTYARFDEAMQDFFRGYGWKGAFVHRTLSLSFDSTRLLTIDLVTHGTSDHYEGLNVTMINKQDGPIVNQYFPFYQWLKDDKNNPITTIWQYDTVITWMGSSGPTSDSVIEMNEAIDEWLESFRNHEE